MALNFGADTNILFSGIYFRGKAGNFIDAVRFKKIELYLSEYIRDELFEVAKRNNFPLKVLNLFYDLGNVHIIRDSSYFSKEEFAKAKDLVRDLKDVPVYLFAKKMISLGKMDFFVSGDKDLLEEKIKKFLSNKIISLSEFNEMELC